MAFDGFRRGQKKSMSQRCTYFDLLGKGMITAAGEWGAWQQEHVEGGAGGQTVTS